MNSQDSDILERLANPLYFVGLLLVFTPLADFMTSVWPLQPGEIRWRFASAALLGGFLFTPLIGATIGVVVSGLMEQRRAQKTLAIINIASAVILVGVIGLLLLDALQLRRAVPPDAQTAFRTSAVRAALKHGSVTVALVWLGLTGLRGAASIKKDVDQKDRTKSVAPMVVTGTSHPTAPS